MEHFIDIKLDRMDNGDIRVFVRADDGPWVERGHFPADQKVCQLMMLKIETKQ